MKPVRRMLNRIGAARAAYNNKRSIAKVLGRNRKTKGEIAVNKSRFTTEELWAIGSPRLRAEGFFGPIEFTPEEAASEGHSYLAKSLARKRQLRARKLNKARKKKGLGGSAYKLTGIRKG